MSGIPKRSNDDGVTHPSSSLAKYSHDDSANLPVTPPTAQVHQQHHRHQQPYQHLQSRTVKGSRSEPGDEERRTQLMHRSPSLPATVSSSDPHLNHTPALLEPRDGAKDGMEIRVENRENTNDGREIYCETKREIKGSKGGDRDGMFESIVVEFSGKGNTGSYTRHAGRETYGDAKTDIQGPKSDRDAKLGGDFSGKGNSGSYTRNTKFDREYHNYNEQKGEVKIEKDGHAHSHLGWKEQKDYQSGKKTEGMSANGDQWGASRGNPQGPAEAVVKDFTVPVEGAHVEGRETIGENKVDAKNEDRFKDKDLKRKELKHREWEDQDKDRNDRRGSVLVGSVMSEPKEFKREESETGRWEGERMDHIKREPQTGAERELSQNEKELGDESAKPADQEYVAPEAERAEKRSRISEKESEVGCFEHYTDDSGKSEVSIVVYRVGECMQELIKLWKEYESSQPDKSGDFASTGPTLEVRIPAEHVTATNRQVRGGQLWGTDIYTDDSDLVAVLMHTGYCRPTASPPPPTMQELRTTIRVLPSQDYYTSKLRNNVRSRSWGAGIGCSYRVERCYILKKGGGTIELEPSLTHSSTVEPTLAPIAVERSMTTRASASNALRQQRFVREVTIQYNLCHEPWIKYSISIVADKGVKKPLFTSARLKKGEVLYLETHSCRYELCFAGEKTMKAGQASQQHSPQEAMEINNNNKSHNHLPNGDKTDSDNSLVDVFRWSRCKKPLPEKVMRSIGFPLSPDHVEVLEENIDWEDIEWSQSGVWITGKEYTLARLHFLSPN